VDGVGVVVGHAAGGGDDVVAGRRLGAGGRAERHAADDGLGDVAVVGGAGDRVGQGRVGAAVDLALAVGGDRQRRCLADVPRSGAVDGVGVVVGGAAGGGDGVVAGRGLGAGGGGQADAADDGLGDVAVVGGAGHGVAQGRVTGPVDLALAVG